MRYITKEERSEVVKDYEFIVSEPKTRSGKSKCINLVASLNHGDAAEILESEWDLKTGIKQAIYNRITVPHGKRYHTIPFIKHSTRERGWYIVFYG